MQLIEASHLSDVQKRFLFELWNREYPVPVAFAGVSDLDRYIDAMQDWKHFLVCSAPDRLDAWAASFTREGETWFALIVSAHLGGRGTGTWLLNRLKEKHQRLCGWVVDHNRYQKRDGTPYQSPIAFYQKNGFSVLNDVRLENENLTAVKIVWESRKE